MTNGFKDDLSTNNKPNHRVRSQAPTAPDPDGPFCISIFQKL